MFKKQLGLICGLAVVAAATFTIPALSANARSDDTGRAVSASEINFEQIAPFVQMGAAWGNRSEGMHGTFGEFPGSASSPPHTHTGDYHGVVIAGTMINPFEGETNSTKMGPGSYWYVPAGMEHVTACISAEPCLFYFHSEGAFDFDPVAR